MSRKIRPAFISLLLCILISLPGCGNQAENVTDYGGETASTKTPPESTTADATRISVLPDVQTEGDPISQDSFSHAGKTVELSITSVTRDSDYLSTYKVAKVTKDLVHETEVIKKLFGDTTKEIHGNVSAADVSVGLIGHLNGRIALAYQELWQKCISEEPADSFPTWEDGEDFFWHTYEGTYDGVTYQLLIAYFEDLKRKQIIFYPKNPGDLINQPDSTELITVSSLTEEGWLKDILKLQNQTRSGEDTLLSEVHSFTKDKLLSELPTEEIFITCSQYNDDPWNVQAAICPLTEIQGGTNDTSKVVLDGYVAQSNWGHNTLRDYNDPAYLNNLATVLVTDHGVIGCELTMSYELVGKLQLVEAFLPFDMEMNALKDAIIQNIDPSKINGSSLKIDSANLVFCPVDSPVSPNEAVFVPAWQFSMMSNGPIGNIFLNIIDGSLIDIQYYQ